MKNHFIFLLLIFVLAACQPKITPTPEIREVTRVVEQTVEVPQIVKETVVVTELVEIPILTPLPEETTESCYQVQPYYFDAMVALVQHYAYLKNHQCEAYMDSFTEKMQSILPQEKDVCENGIIDVKINSIYPVNYLKNLSDGSKIADVDDLILFQVSMEKYYFTGYVEDYFIWTPVVLEDGEWKIGQSRTNFN